MTGPDDARFEGSVPAHVGLIWAQASGGVIGDGNTIPWHVPEDMAHFKEVTAGHAVAMGRKTWDSLPKRFRPLPGRRNIVVTRNDGWSADGAETVGSIEGALALVDTDTDTDTIWIIGGGEIYRAAMPFATELQVTEVDLAVTGETLAPTVSSEWTATTGQWRTSRVEGIRYRWVQYGKAYQTN